jgi:hypothetical protein
MNNGKRMADITDREIADIKGIMDEEPALNRSALSHRLCELWGWRDANGRDKDIACRKLMRNMERRGMIALPKQAHEPAMVSGKRIRVPHMTHSMELVACSLRDIQPLSVEIADKGARLAEFKSLVDQFHYLSLERSIGENVKYIVRSKTGAPVACVMFSGAAWSCRDRDRHIGWDQKQKAEGLALLANNSRFLVLPWIRVPCLASHTLSIVSKRVSGDFEAKYSHPIVCLETFVERGRFRAVCYRAANWARVGQTTGRGRDGGHHDAVLPVKDIYLYPLAADFRQKLTSGKNGRDNDARQR